MHVAEFFRTIKPRQKLAAQRRMRFVRTLFVFVFVALVLWVIGLVIASAYATSQLFQAQENMAQAKAAFVSFDFEQAKGHTQQARASLDSAGSVLWFIRSASLAPFFGDSFETFTDVIVSSEALLKVFDPLIDLGLDLIQLSGITREYLQQAQAGISPEVTFDDLTTQTKRAVLSRLAASANDLDLLVAELGILEEDMSLLVHAMKFWPFVSILDPLIEDLRAVHKSITLLAIAARLLPPFAGLEDPSSILILFLNNNELRPGGGFIGSYGVLEMYAGDIAHLETADVYALDRAAETFISRAAPEPLSRYNATEHWFLRDSNWSPDFADSSQQAISMFLEEAGFLPEGSDVPATDHIDHLVAFTPTYASDLLAITGPITVGGQTFTAENVADLLEYQVQYGHVLFGVPEVQRKQILADLVNEMKSLLYALPAVQWPQVIEVTQRALREKQLLLYSTHASVQQTLTRVGWAGEVVSRSVDTLMVVDANLASLKSDPVVKRNVGYEIYQNTSGQWIGRVSIHYKHVGAFDWKTTRYRTYTRVYLPIGTQLLAVEGSWLNDKTQNSAREKGIVDVVDELGFVSFGAFTSVEPGEEHTLTFEFVLAPEVEEAIDSGIYDLTVIKQAGAQNNALTLDLNFGKNVSRASPAEDSNEWGDDVYRLNTILDQDVIVDVSFYVQ